MWLGHHWIIQQAQTWFGHFGALKFSQSMWAGLRASVDRANIDIESTANKLSKKNASPFYLCPAACRPLTFIASRPKLNHQSCGNYKLERLVLMSALPLLFKIVEWSNAKSTTQEVILQESYQNLCFPCGRKKIGICLPKITQ
jgi:hypothetical protein